MGLNPADDAPLSNCKCGQVNASVCGHAECCGGGVLAYHSVDKINGESDWMDPAQYVSTLSHCSRGTIDKGLGTELREQVFASNKIKIIGAVNTVSIDSAKSCPQIRSEEITRTAIVGQGQFGVVVRAIYKESNVAVKFYKGIDRKFSELIRFQNELDLWSSFRHPNIVKLYGYIFDWSKQERGFVMEICNSNLREYLYSEKGAMSPMEDFLFISKEVISGLGYLHSINVVHGDLKPSNILLSDGCRVVKLCDFDGCVKATEYLEFDQCIIGTPRYMAPERFSQPVQLSPGCDIYSFGVLLWEMVELTKPFTGLDTECIKASVLANRRPGMSENFVKYPPFVKLLVSRCWGQSMRSRPDAKEVRRILDGEETEALLGDQWCWMAVFTRLKKPLLLFLAVLVCTLLAVFVSVASRNTRKRPDCNFDNITGPCILNIPEREQKFVKWKCRPVDGLCDLHVDTLLPGTVEPFRDPLSINVYRDVLSLSGGLIKPRTEFLRACFNRVNSNHSLYQEANAWFSTSYSAGDLTVPRKLGLLFLLGKCPSAEGDVHLRRYGNDSKIFNVPWSSTPDPGQHPRAMKASQGTFKTIPTGPGRRTVSLVQPYFASSDVYRMLGVWATTLEESESVVNSDQVDARVLEYPDWSIPDSMKRKAEFVLHGVRSNNIIKAMIKLSDPDQSYRCNGKHLPVFLCSLRQGYFNVQFGAESVHDDSCFWNIEGLSSLEWMDEYLMPVYKYNSSERARSVNCTVDEAREVHSWRKNLN